MKASLVFIYRKFNERYFSIENVFSNLEYSFRDQFKTFEWFAPSNKADPLSILRNGFAARKIKSNIYHITGDVHYLTLFLPKRKTILTIHDCVFLYEKNYFKRLILKLLFLDLPIRNARFITTISDATKEEIVSQSLCDPEKIIVIPNALDEGFQASSKPFNEVKPVILQIGTFPNKNLERVFEALHGIDCILNIVGALTGEHKQLLIRNKINYVNNINITKEELIKRYDDCDMVLFASTFEGFGLPVIEAQQSGKPLVTSNISPIRDVAGNGAVFVDPLEVQSIREGIMKIISDANLRNKLVKEGFKNINRFSKENIVQQYGKLYREILENV